LLPRRHPRKKNAEETKSGVKASGSEADAKQVLELLQKIAKEGREKQLKRAADLKAGDKGDGELKVGWSFPKESQLVAKWDGWETRFKAQTSDLNTLFKDHFEETNARVKEENAKDSLAAL